MRTPLLEYHLDRSLVVRIYVKHDDCYPAYGGGNKARKITYLEKEIRQKKSNALVTTGGIQSNHCRVAALLAAKNNWKCSLVLHGIRDQYDQQKGNALIMRQAGAEIRFSEPEKIGSEMKRAMEELSNIGFRPYYLNGGGHHPLGVQAYIDAVKELEEQCESTPFPDHIFIASGTGSTQAGIVLGLKRIKKDRTKVHGISIARNKEKGLEGVLEAIRYFSDEIEKKDIMFYDEYLFGGYSQSNEELRSFAIDILRSTGILLDLTYSAKAFYGMLQIIKREGIEGNVLFWHTGSIFNLLA